MFYARLWLKSKYRNGANARNFSSGADSLLKQFLAKGFIANYKIRQWNEATHIKAPKKKTFLVPITKEYFGYFAYGSYRHKFIKIVAISMQTVVFVTWPNEWKNDRSLKPSPRVYYWQMFTMMITVKKAAKRNTTLQQKWANTQNKTTHERRANEREPKKRVNLTFINEHCFRMSILLNMGHTNFFKSCSCIWTCTSTAIQHCFIILIVHSIIIFSTYSICQADIYSWIYLKWKISTTLILLLDGIFNPWTHMELDHFNYYRYLSTNIRNADERLP